MGERGPSSGLVRHAVGPGPAVHELRGTGAPGSLTRAEARDVASAVPSRRREFAAGRACARSALADLGHHGWSLNRGPRGEPLWPPGVVGSISHCPGFAAAAAAPSAGTLALGIDVEVDAPLPRDVAAEVLSAEETASVRGLAAQDRVTPWERLLFSAKESLFKAWYPLRHEWLGFEEAHVELEPDGTFRAHLLRPDHAPLPRVVTGRWARGDGVLVTAVTLPASGTRQA